MVILDNNHVFFLQLFRLPPWKSNNLVIRGLSIKPLKRGFALTKEVWQNPIWISHWYIKILCYFCETCISQIFNIMKYLWTKLWIYLVLINSSWASFYGTDQHDCVHYKNTSDSCGVMTSWIQVRASIKASYNLCKWLLHGGDCCWVII